MSDRIAVMRAGRFVQVGSPEEIYRRPVNRFVAAFMGEVNILAVEGGVLSGLGLAVPDAAGPFAVLRPEALRLDGGALGVEAEVAQTLLLGSRVQYHLRAGGQALIAEVPAGGRALLGPGDRARFGFDAADIAWVAE